MRIVREKCVGSGAFVEYPVERNRLGNVSNSHQNMRHKNYKIMLGTIARPQDDPQG